ncbi:unnamed protein product [Medioppia subpectinata]|uniref:RING-type domain-containing protein n=1 Tax=Medioppia subpectinata TaxID=1979941 RepID=A0A7R9KWN7_9ACAR|nr:unnamed protein product [Medioppia subpectinata]CAG2111215.1 unnamed protein product [Medioppia subpectinata]
MISDRFPDLSAEDRDEYTCSICQEIFDCPVTTTCCLQTFCEDCITQWLQTNTTCPYDRKPLTSGQLSRAPRVMLNTLGRFKIQCDYWENGCRDVIKLEDLTGHTVNCRYNVANCSKCQCAQTSGHNCIKALQELNSKLIAENKTLKLTVLSLKSDHNIHRVTVVAVLSILCQPKGITIVRVIAGRDLELCVKK